MSLLIALFCAGSGFVSSTALAGTTAVSGGEFYTCAIDTGSSLACWGDNGFGQTNAPTGAFVALSAGGYHTCAIRTNSSLACWGNNGNGQTNAPAGSFKAVGAGTFHSCAIRTDDTLACWGSNFFGERDAPSGSFVAVSGGEFHTCAIRTDATLTCWGDNTFFGEATAPPGTFTALSAGRTHTCAIRTDGSLACWGDNDRGESNPPSGTFIGVAAGLEHSCAIRTDGTLTCWGDNSGGQLNNVPSGSFVAISAGGFHTCAIRTSGSLVCWGSDVFGQTDVPTALTTYESAVTADHPVSYWRLGERSGATAADLVGGNDGRYMGGFRLGQQGIFGDDSAVGLDGHTGYVRVPDATSLHTGDHFSLEVWLKRGYLSNDVGVEGLFLKGYQLYLDVGQLVLRKPLKRVIARSTVRITDSSFHHVVATKTGRDVHLYIDGRDVTGPRVDPQTITDTNNQLSIGAGAGVFRGTLDEAAVYDYALTPAQVHRHFDAAP